MILLRICWSSSNVIVRSYKTNVAIWMTEFRVMCSNRNLREYLRIMKLQLVFHVNIISVISVSPKYATNV